MKKIILTITVAILCGCSDYEKTVSSRSVAVEGQYDKTTGGTSGDIKYSVTYK